MNYPKFIVSNQKENFISLQRLHVSPIPTPDFPYFTVKMGGGGEVQTRGEGVVLWCFRSVIETFTPLYSDDFTKHIDTISMGLPMYFKGHR